MCWDCDWRGGDSDLCRQPRGLYFSERKLWDECPQARSVLERLVRVRGHETGLDSFYRNGIYEALRQSSPEVEAGKPIILDGQHLLDMAAAVADYLNETFDWPSSPCLSTQKETRRDN